MRIVCPSCTAAYDVPDGLVAARRVLRCAKCGAEFSPEVPSAPAVRAEAPSAMVEVVERSPGQDAPRLAPADGLSALAATPPTGLRAVGGSRKLAVIAAWGFSLALLGVGGWAFIAWRQVILHAWPAAGRVYAFLGYAS